MILTRLGYFVIALIIASAAVAVIIVLRPDEASSPAPDADLPRLGIDDVVNYSRFGAVESIETDGDSLRVRFVEGFDTQEHFGTDSRFFVSTVPQGQTIERLLEQAGVPVNAEGGIEVSAR